MPDYSVPYTQHSCLEICENAMASLDWDAPKESWFWMNGSALAKLLRLPTSKPSVTALGMAYRRHPKGMTKRFAFARLMLIPPLRAALTPV